MNPTKWVPNGSDKRSTKAIERLTKPIKKPTKIVNRLRAVLFHVPIYSFRGIARLADDCGVARSTMSRTIRGETSPTLTIMQVIVKTLSEKTGRSLDICEIFSTEDDFPTHSICHLMGCNGCIPSFAWNAKNQVKPEWQDVEPGDWSWSTSDWSCPTSNKSCPMPNRSCPTSRKPAKQTR
jgi:DNA-binding XRE family transcriptional regulator